MTSAAVRPSASPMQQQAGGRRRPSVVRGSHTTYSLKRCKDTAGLKALSQNLTCSSILATHRAYSVLSRGDAEARVSSRSGDLNSLGDESEEELE